MNDETKEFVKASRKKLKLTQEELAIELGMERRSIVRFEAGDDLPRLVRLAINHLLAVQVSNKRRRIRRRARQEKSERVNA